MTDITPFDVVPDEVVAPAPARPRLLLIGTALVSLAVAIGFSGLIGIYVAERAAVLRTGEVWLPSGVSIPLTQPNMMMFTMVFSAATMAWAIQAMRSDDRANHLTATAITLLLGFAFLAQTAYLFTIMEIEALADTRSTLLYGVIGTHIVITLAGLAYVAGMALRAIGGEYSAKDLEGVYGAAMFWFTTVGLYLVLWYVIYITK